jgi:predicted RNase H-related nuclease YkuK (DUF458 family)
MDYRKLYSGEEVHLESYISEYLETHHDVDILIGCDSQNFSDKTIYAVVVALYNRGKGAHVLCTKETVPFEKNTPNRLMTEVWKAVEVAEFLRNNDLPRAEWIDIDLNPDPRFKSNSVLRQAVGLVEGMGYKVRYKHAGAMITYTANHLVRL